MTRQVINTRTLLLCGIPLLLIAIFRLQLSGHGGHMDEYDYLFVGKTLLAGDHWPTHSYIFGWDLNWLLLAWGDMQLGGITGARTLAALLGMFSIVGMYWFAIVLWRNKAVALLAALMLSLEAAHLYTSRIATYDIISFTFFIWSLPALWVSCQTDKKSWQWTILAASLLIGAVLSKYTAIIYLPFIASIVLLYRPKQAITGAVLIIITLGAYGIIHFEQLEVLYNIQINGAHEKNSTSADIVMRTARQLTALLLAAALCILYALIFSRSNLSKLLTLVLLGLPLFTYHLLSENVIALQKHLLYTSAFLIPMVAWGLVSVAQKLPTTRYQYWFIGIVLVMYAYSNHQQLQTVLASYPDVRPFLPITQHMQMQESVLSEDPYLFRYLLYDQLDQSQIAESTWLDNNKDGLRELNDIQQAIWDRKFTYVFLNDQQHASDNIKLRKMLSQRGYITYREELYKLKTMSGDIRSGSMTLHALPKSALSLSNN